MNLKLQKYQVKVTLDSRDTCTSTNIFSNNFYITPNITLKYQTNILSDACVFQHTSKKKKNEKYELRQALDLRN